MYLVFFCSVLPVIYSSRIESTNIVRDAGGTVVGPALEFSKTVLRTNEEFKWWCRENTAYENNNLERMNDQGEFVSVGKSVSRTCTAGDFECTILSGTISWKKEYASVYRCSPWPDEQHNVLWIEPEVQIKQKYELGNDVFGKTVTVWCYVPLAPTFINYKGIVDIEWQHQNIRSPSYDPISLGSKYASIIPPTGSNFSLEIRDFSGLNDGGKYRCVPTVKGYPNVLESESIEVTVRASASLTNSRRQSFDFGLGESINITCLVDSYPYADEISMEIDGLNVRDIPLYAGSYLSDTRSHSALQHSAKLTIRNVTESLNGSIVECVAVRGGRKEGRDRKTIQVFTIPPPDDHENPEEAGQPGNTANPKKPWVVAIAVIIPIVIILVIIVIVVWKCYHRDDEYMPANT